MNQQYKLMIEGMGGKEFSASTLMQWHHEIYVVCAATFWYSIGRNRMVRLGISKELDGPFPITYEESQENGDHRGIPKWTYCFACWMAIQS